MNAVRNALAVGGVLLVFQLGCGVGPDAGQSADDPPTALESAGAALAASNVVSVTASGNQSGNPPQSAIDLNLTTRWASLGKGQWIAVDVGGAATVSAVNIAWYRGAVRSYTFDILTDPGTGTWSTAFSGTSSGTTGGMERYPIAATSARFVKIVVYGNSTNDWASIKELGVELGSQSAPVTVAVSPATASLQASVSATFAATVSNTANTTVAWSIQEGAAGGAVSSGGVYTAPSTAGTYHVVATSQADSTKSATATVTVAAAAQTVAISVSPGSASIQSGQTASFSATVTGSTNTSATWSVQEGAAGGSVSSGGVYTAPSTAGTYHVVATSQADSTKSATATVTVTAPAQTVAISVSPGSASIQSGQTASFSATVTGSTNTSATWSVQEGAAGGTVSSTGIYTAPSTAGTYHVVATSQADTTKSATAIVTVTATPPSSTWVTASGAACTNGPTTSCEYASCKDEALRTSGVIHYYCDCQAGAAAGCAVGNDANAGTSASAPRRTFANAVGVLNALNAGDTVAFCRGGSFGSQGSDWTSARGTTTTPVIVRDYRAPWNGGTEGRPILHGQINFNGSTAIRMLNIRVDGTGVNFGVLARNNTTDMNFCNVEFDGADIDVYSQTSTRAKAIGSRFLNTGSMAWLGDGDGTEFRNNYLWNNGYGGTIFLHSVYFGGNGISHNEFITDNEIHAAPNAVGSVLAVHGGHQGTTIQNNVVSCENGAANTAWGINMKSGDYASPEMNDNLVLRGNKVIECGNSAIVATSCRWCLIENNIVINTTQGTSGISIPCQVADTAKGDPVSTSITMRNNTVYTTQSGGTAISMGIEGSGHIVENNVTSVNAGTACYGWPSGAGYTSRDYNQCSGGSSPSPGTHSLTANPLFVNAPAGDLRLQSGSSLLHAGDSAQNPGIDITGAARGSPPSLGAYDQ